MFYSFGDGFSGSSNSLTAPTDQVGGGFLKTPYLVFRYHVPAFRRSGFFCLYGFP